MPRGQGWRIGLTVVLLLGSLWYLYPSVRLWQLDPAERDQMAKLDPKGWIDLQSKVMKLGLDLKGGMRVVLQVDRSQLNPDEAKDAVDRAKEILRNLEESELTPEGTVRQSTRRQQDRDKLKNLAAAPQMDLFG